jgi:hypothetical protein
MCFLHSLETSQGSNDSFQAMEKKYHNKASTAFARWAEEQFGEL